MASQLITSLTSLSILQGTSGLVISIIAVISRVSSGAIVISIQSFYPEKE